MPPKNRSKTVVKKVAVERASDADLVDKQTLDLEFLSQVDSSSDEDAISKTFHFMSHGLSEGSREYVKASCLAVEQICEDDEGLLTMIKADGIEQMLAIIRYVPTADISPSLSEAVNAAAAALHRRAALWLEHVDEVDFHLLPEVLYVATWLGAEDEDVALHALGAIERFVLHAVENSTLLLESDGLEVLHRIIGAHRAPELVTEALMLLFRVCDLPPETIVGHVVKESGLIQTVVESMQHAPLNMRLQFAGLRLLALWARFRAPEVDPNIPSMSMNDVKDLIGLLKEARAMDVAQEVISNLQRSGLAHAASWMSVIALRLPESDPLPEVDETTEVPSRKPSKRGSLKKVSVDPRQLSK
ncbi:unnamed protein product [Polarella glacialis]|uniref:Uncharacterized protein n=1 Tax=Polarella glacialis TaxID=89957 RepID=A0A813JYG7_POLGL|nr:unnamed protein product [Polarella glacialis]CAE8689015.1 unnamed protein product [Polarella glacialis]